MSWIARWELILRFDVTLISFTTTTIPATLFDRKAEMPSSTSDSVESLQVVPDGEGTTMCRYSELTGNKPIRILKLFPAKDEPLCGTLIYSALDDPSMQHYEALSYVWGPRSLAACIECDGQSICITTNCHDALTRIRSCRRAENICVDAICIDQGLIKEHNEQVANMAEFYRSASTVLIWLKFNEPYGNTAPKFIAAIATLKKSRILPWIFIRGTFGPVEKLIRNRCKFPMPFSGFD